MTEDFPKDIEGWRVFSLKDDGELTSPYGSYLAAMMTSDDKASDDYAWRRGPNFARCRVSEHFVPDDDCTCGFRATEDLGELLAFVERVALPGSGGRSMLFATGVVARVKLFGRLRPGVAIGIDDPPTTWRANQARVLEIHLAPEHSDQVEALKAYYAVPVVTYTAEDWFNQSITPVPVVEPVSDIDRYLAEIRSRGFGVLDTKLPSLEDFLIDQGRKVCGALRQGVPFGDIAVIMFDSSGRPTWTQAINMMRAAIRAFAPELEFAGGPPVFETTPSFGAVVARNVEIAALPLTGSAV